MQEMRVKVSGNRKLYDHIQRSDDENKSVEYIIKNPLTKELNYIEEKITYDEENNVSIGFLNDITSKKEKQSKLERLKALLEANTLTAF